MHRRMPPASIARGQQDFIVNVGDRVFFEGDSTELTPQARATLDKQAQWLTTCASQRPVHHRGHADERGTRVQYRRSAHGVRSVAATIRRRVVSRRQRMRTDLACGKERPVAVCNDISADRRTVARSPLLGVSSDALCAGFAAGHNYPTLSRR